MQTLTYAELDKSYITNLILNVIILLCYVIVYQ